MKFGMFMSPFHSTKGNPTNALARDLDLVEWLDHLGYDEVIFGEHHSGGMEILGAPELFVAAAARRTSRIKLGSGVVSLSYHNPFQIAERYVALDHLTRGRLIMGIGPGALPQDAMMFGISPMDQRQRMADSIDAIIELLESDEPVNRDKGWFTLKDASLQLKPYSATRFEIGAVCVVSPSGPSLAGRHGLSMISTSATSEGGFQALAQHMSIAQESAEKFGSPPPRREDWRLVGPMHIAETREQAEREVQFGIEEMVAQWLRITEVWSAATGQPSRFQEGKTAIEMVRNANAGVIGTPDDAIEQIRRLQEQSGGFGTYMLMGHEWANPEATKRSLDLFAEYVIPEINGTNIVRKRSQQSFFDHLAEGRDEGAAAVRHAIASYNESKSFERQTSW